MTTVGQIKRQKTQKRWNILAQKYGVAIDKDERTVMSDDSPPRPVRKLYLRRRDNESWSIMSDITGGPTAATTKPTPDDIRLALKTMDNRSEPLRMRRIQSLCRWSRLGEDPDFMNLLRDFGGIPRILNLIDQNMNDVKFIACAMELLGECFRAGVKHPIIMNKDATIFLKNKGIDTIFNANKICITADGATDVVDADQLDASQRIWNTCACLCASQSVTKMLSKDEILIIFDSGLRTLSMIDNTRVYQFIFTIFAEIALHPDINAAVPFFERRNVFAECVRALETSTGYWGHGTQRIWNRATMFFRRCCSENLDILRSEADVLAVVPFLTDYTAKKPELADNAGAFDLRAKLMKEHEGILANDVEQDRRTSALVLL